MTGHFCLVASQNCPQGQIYYIAVEVEMYTEIRQLDNIHSLFQVYVIYVKDSSYCFCEHYGTTVPFAKEITEFYVTLLQLHQNGCNPQITANVPLIFFLVHMTENSLNIFVR